MEIPMATQPRKFIVAPLLTPDCFPLPKSRQCYFYLYPVKMAAIIGRWRLTVAQQSANHQETGLLIL